MAMQARTVANVLSFAALAGVLAYAFVFAPGPEPRPSTPAPLAGSAHADASQVTHPDVMRFSARVTFSDTITDVAVRGSPDVARATCQRIVDQRLAQRFDTTVPKLARACDPGELPALPHGITLHVHQELDDLDLLLAGAHDVKATIDEITPFDSKEHCERALARITAVAAHAPEAPSSTALAALHDELVSAKAELDRACTDPSASACAQAREKVSILAKAASAPPPAPKPARGSSSCETQ
jgi:hypothetical protein